MMNTIKLVVIGVLALTPALAFGQDFLPFGPTPGEGGMRIAGSLGQIAEAMRVNGAARSIADRDRTLNDYESRIWQGIIIALGLAVGGWLAGRNNTRGGATCK
jgi:hypothetical protein